MGAALGEAVPFDEPTGPMMSAAIGAVAPGVTIRTSVPGALLTWLDRCAERQTCVAPP